ncbi:uncharacterized protein [Cardiocondyla obscurior]|uniref:uncharacterized protein n=1 Tax=Cardiocondyla obscurior TaxID=286306 RepID=UPI0039656FA5
MLIGAELFWELVCVGQMRATRDHPMLQKTRLGWVLAGRSVNARGAPTGACALHAVISDAELHESVNRFWELEEIAGASRETASERACEEHFLENVRVNREGRYIVKLPVKPNALALLGESRNVALKRLHGVEGKFRRDPRFKGAYIRFMREYAQLGHMRLIAPRERDEPGALYLPHHGVFKRGDASGKLRVVFDASCKTSRGCALNDALMTGPTIQQDLVAILTRFRTWRCVFAADIVKMYRQILIDESQTKLQRILWRENENEAVRTYELRTVTYGMTAAPFLATRCLLDLARKNEAAYPIGAKRIARDFYIDDLLTGADTVTDAITAREQIISILRRGKFELSKWLSNHAELIPHDEQGESQLALLAEENDKKILGIQWDSRRDEIIIEASRNPQGERITKRAILTEIASIFDPLGIMGPLIIVAKLIMQETWQAQVEWDETLSPDLHHRWSSFREQLQILRGARVPRWVGSEASKQVQIHGFCDASERAYGACIYLRTTGAFGQHHAALLTAKSRVAPVRAVSLPRLELSAAVLLARLIEKLRESWQVEKRKLILWSDSTITLQWIASPSRKWKAFVANRVGEIQRLTRASDWRHVPSTDNPADMLSRGVSGRELKDSSLWWNGPSFLRSEETEWPNNLIKIPDELPEQQRAVAAVAAVESRGIIRDLLIRKSSLNRIVRIIAYCRRVKCASYERPTGITISPREFDEALRVVVREVQREAFPHEYKLLQERRELNSRSHLLGLTPFLDESGIIRVGGRLKNATMNVDAKHPMLLPKHSELTTLIVRAEHVNALHAGAQTTLAMVRQRFWPIAARAVVRKIVRNCVTCFKCKPKFSQAKMADLPGKRVNVARPFTHTGVDYAGPILLKEHKRRNAKLTKAYLAIFVCFTVRAVHIEIVSDLTSGAFIAAFKRFISRRGRPECMYSDNGTTFVGAEKQLREMLDCVRSEATSTALREFLSERGISWKFMPPYAPHFGGLWEAAVKSTKTHLNRVVGQAHLTYEEMYTSLCEIEAILNSRPLAPISADPNDLECLTPGHFLIGAALCSLSFPDFTHVPESRLLRWQRVEQMRQHFWKRWSAEYLHTLIQRTKWRTDRGTPIGVGQLVVVQQPGLGPLQWLLGRVETVHPGPDGVVRTATIRTKKGEVTRPSTKLAVLPLDPDENVKTVA